MRALGWNDYRLSTSLIIMISVPAVAAIVAAGPAAENPPVAVRSSDIPGRFQIVGTLGRPLGTLLTIRGRWERPPRRKFNTITFHVTHIGGDRLANEVCFVVVRPLSEFSSVKAQTPREGDVWEICGFESGGFFGSPPEAVAQVLKPGEAVSQGSHAGRFSFDTRFEYTSWKSLGLDNVGGGRGM